MLDTNEFNKERESRAIEMDARSFLRRHDLPLTASEDLATLLRLTLQAGETRNIAPPGSHFSQYANFDKRNPAAAPNAYREGFIGIAIALSPLVVYLLWAWLR